MTLPAVALKRCSTCREHKPPGEFHRQAASRDGLMPYCRPCNSAKAADWRARNPERVAATYAANRESATARERARRLRRYGLTPTTYAALLDAQGGRCAGCTAEFDATPYVDHCHTTGVVRGLLCNGCNKALGFAQDDPARLRALADYLEVRR